MTTNSEKYDFFVCYDTNTADTFALRTAESLERLNARTFVAVRPGDIPAGTLDEQKFRYDVIRNSEHFLLIGTNGILDSPEVRNELRVALDSDRKIIFFRDLMLNVDRFRIVFQDLKRLQWICEFSDKAELAKGVADWYEHLNLKKRSQDFEPSGKARHQPDGRRLIVDPKWSVKHVSEMRPDGRIIFDISNETGDPVFLHGYRMFRRAPDGTKDFFYKGSHIPANRYKGWASSKYFRMLLLDKDRHVFNWGEVKIPETYGINHRGLWGTEVQVAYVHQGDDSLLVSIGTTQLDFK